MAKEQEFICLVCPLACKIKLTSDENGQVIDVDGNQCPSGEEYAISEFRSPQRILTTTVKTASTDHPRLPVSTNKPIPKDLLRECMKISAEVVVKPPIEIGEIVVPNILDTGADMVATSDLQ